MATSPPVITPPLILILILHSGVSPPPVCERRSTVCLLGTYNGEDEEQRGDGGGAVEHDADVVTCQRNVAGRRGNQNWGQQEADGCSQLDRREKRVYIVDYYYYYIPRLN